MAIIILVVGVICGVGGYVYLDNAENLFQQMAALMLFIIAAILVSGAAIVSELAKLHQTVVDLQRINQLGFDRVGDAVDGNPL